MLTLCQQTHLRDGAARGLHCLHYSGDLRESCSAAHQAWGVPLPRGTLSWPSQTHKWSHTSTMKADSHTRSVCVVCGRDGGAWCYKAFLLGMTNTQRHLRWADGRGSGSPGWLPPGLIGKICQDSSGPTWSGHVSYPGKWMVMVGCFSGPINWTGLQSLVQCHWHPLST